MSSKKKPSRQNNAVPTTSHTDSPAKHTVSVKTVQYADFHGPIPPPETMAKYKHVLPSAPERILAMAEKEQEHQHTTVSKVVNNEAKQLKRGQVIGAVIVISLLGLCFFALYLGHPWFAVGSFLTAAAPLVTIFFRKRKPPPDNH